MTKTNRTTLIITALLGVLLYTILRFAHDLNVAWDGSPLEPPLRIEETQASNRFRITTVADLRPMLGNSFASAIDGYTKWSDARGFSGKHRLFGLPDSKPVGPLAVHEQTNLRPQSDAGKAAASQELAEQILFTDTFKAIALFRLAAEQGSTFALLRITSLLESLDAAATGNDFADLIGPGINNSLRLTALGYLVTAIRDGGAPIVDHALLAWLDQLGTGLTNDEQVAVCKWSERTLINLAKSRARLGKPAVTTVAPPIFFAVPDLADRLPCNQTAYPIDSLMELADCTVSEVSDAADKHLNLYICLKKEDQNLRFSS